MYIIIKFQKVKAVPFAIAFQLCCNNIILTVIVSLSMIINNIYGRWILGSNVCIAVGLMTFVSGNLRVFFILAFSINYFSFVFTPFLYIKNGGKVVFILSITSWCVAIAVSLTIIPKFLDCYGYSEATLLCLYSSSCENCQEFRFTYLFGVYLPSLVIPGCLFTALYLKGRLLRVKQKRVLKEYKSISWTKEWKAFKTFIFLLASVTLVNLLSVSIISIANELLDNEAQGLMVLLSADIIFTLVITDPIIILGNKKINKLIKEKARKVCCKQSLKSSQLNQETRSKNNGLHHSAL